MPKLSHRSFSNNLKRDPLEIQHPKFENRFGFIESVRSVSQYNSCTCIQIKFLLLFFFVLFLINAR